MFWREFFNDHGALAALRSLHPYACKVYQDQLASGEMIEAAMIGHEGVVGGLSALDSKVSISRAIVQIAGTASTVDVAE